MVGFVIVRHMTGVCALNWHLLVLALCYYIRCRDMGEVDVEMEEGMRWAWGGCIGHASMGRLGFSAPIETRLNTGAPTKRTRCGGARTRQGEVVQIGEASLVPSEL